MSQERRKRQQKREREEQPRKGLARNIVIAVLIIAVFGAAYYFGIRKRHSRMDNFAQCLTDKGAKMYGAFWCPHCEEQKADFGSSFDHVNYVECGVKGNTRAQSPECKQAGIKHYPTWEFAGGSREEGNKTLHYLGEKTGCSLP